MGLQLTISSSECPKLPTYLLIVSLHILFVVKYFAAVCIFSFLFYPLSLTRPAVVNTHVGIAYTTFHLAVHMCRNKLDNAEEIGGC